MFGRKCNKQAFKINYPWPPNMSHTDFRGGFWIIKTLVYEQESSAPNFIPKDLLDIICILERDEWHHSYKIVRNRTGFALIAKFGAKNVESNRRTTLHFNKQ